MDEPGTGQRQRIRHEADRIRGSLERRLALGGFGILAMLAAGFLFLRQGTTAAVLGVGLILLGGGILALLWLLLTAMELWAKRGDD